MNFITIILSSIVLFTSSQFQLSIDNTSSLYFNSGENSFFHYPKRIERSLFHHYTGRFNGNDTQPTVAVSEVETIELLNYDINHIVADYFSFETTYDFIKSAIKNKKIRTEKAGKAKGTLAMDLANPKQRIIRLMNHANDRFFKNEPLYMIDDFIVPSFAHTCTQHQRRRTSKAHSYSHTKLQYPWPFRV